MTTVNSEWDYYLQAFRLHAGLKPEANTEARKLLRQSTARALDQKRVFPRSYGLLAYTTMNKWLSNWISQSEAQSILGAALDDIRRVTNEQGLPRNILDELEKVGGSIDAIVKGVIRAYAEAAVAFDDDDHDNRWSLGTAYLYSGNIPGAFKEYEAARDLADRHGVPDVSKGSLAADLADALFFTGGEDPKSNEDYIAAIKQAISITDEAIRNNPSDPKHRRWNWTLGWAYYELAGFTGSPDDYRRSLEILNSIRPNGRPVHDLIVKNFIASNVSVGNIEEAQQLARMFMEHNPDYTLAVEDRWPYRTEAQRERWKGHLREAGLPDNY